MKNKAKETFGGTLRSLRLKAKLSMGEVARTLGISVVYYSEVEGGRKKPFPEKTVDFVKLAKTLQGDVNGLRELAQAQRQELRIDLFKADHQTAKLALLFGRRVDSDSLTVEQVEQIQQILESGEDDE